MAPSRRRPFGFTLIELLVVIAIIAILTAILLPVFATVREGSRQSVAISNLHDIQQKMEQYKLDNHKYPDVLFGYAYPNSTMTTGLGLAQADDKKNGTNYAALYFSGLYPAYIKDPNVFTDPNNPLDANAPAATQVTAYLTDTYIIYPCNATSDNVLRGGSGSLCTPGTQSGQALATQRQFYKLDAYDSGPLVTGGNKVDTAQIVTRYQTVREPTVYSPNLPDGDYNRQLRWQNPPADTVVAMTSYHVQNADKVLLMFASGAVKKLKAEDFLPNEGSGNFWKIKP